MSHYQSRGKYKEDYTMRYSPCNLKTIIFTPTAISIFNGWYVTANTRGNFVVHGLGVVNKPATIETNLDGAKYLQTMSIKLKDVVYSVQPEEDSPYDTPVDVPVTELELLPTPDEKTYYRIFLNEDASLSPDFEIFVDTKVEDPYHSEKYNRVVYAALPSDLPLERDNSGTLCVSPI